MATRVHDDRRQTGGAVRADPALPRHAAIARLLSDCTALLSVADSLERLAADLHKSHRAEDAQLLAEGLYWGLERHLDEEGAVLQAVAAAGAEEFEDALERTRDEHLALRELVDPVIRDLRDIARVGLPTRPNRFVIETTVLCEFIRLHVKYKRQTVYPLLSALEEGDPAAVGSAMRRRMG